MKAFHKILLTLAAAAIGSLPAAAYSPPTDGQIGQALANPGMITNLLGDADGEQAADLLVRILARIDGNAGMAESQKNYLASFYTARITFLLGGQAETMVQRLLPRVPETLLPAVVAGLSVGGRGSAAFMAFLRERVGENLLEAVNAPEVPLTDPVYGLLLQTLGAAQSLPPLVVDSLPPPIPEGRRTGELLPGPEPTPTPRRRPTPTPQPAPPVVEPYQGQG